MDDKSRSPTTGRRKLPTNVTAATTASLLEVQRVMAENEALKAEAKERDEELRQYRNYADNARDYAEGCTQRSAAVAVLSMARETASEHRLENQQQRLATLNTEVRDAERRGSMMYSQGRACQGQEWFRWP